jgi:Tol biopolymer transport system component
MNNFRHSKKLHAQRVLEALVILVLAMETSCSPLSISASPVTHPTPMASSTPLALSTTTTTFQDCFLLFNLEQSKSLIQGRLIFSRSDLEKNITFDISSMDEMILGDWLDSVQVSPDDNTLAVGNRESHTVSIISREKTTSYPIPEEGYEYISDFLPDGRIVLTLGTDPGSTARYDEKTGYTDEFYTMAAKTGEATFHRIFLPYYIASGKHADSFIKYSPDLRYVMYSANHSGYRTILLDTESNKIVWEGAGIGTRAVADGVVSPIWRPTTHATTLIYDSSNDQSPNEIFYSLSIDGSLSKLTQIEEFIQVPYRLRFPSWSPDGRFLAFTILDGANSSLGIFDTIQSKLITPCYSDEMGKDDRFLWGDMTWSPDSQYLAIVKRTGTVENEIYFFNPADEVVYKQTFETNKPGWLSLLGWLNWDTP